MFISLFQSTPIVYARIVRVESPQVLQLFLRHSTLSNAISLIQAPFARQMSESLADLAVRISDNPQFEELLKKVSSAVQTLVSRGLPPLLQDLSALIPLLGLLVGKGEEADLVRHLLLSYIAGVLTNVEGGRAVTEGDLLNRAGETNTKLPLSPQDLTRLLPEFGKDGAKGFTDLSLSPSPFKALPEFLSKWRDLTRLSLNGGTMTALGKEVGSLTHLEALSVSGNNLAKIDPAVASLQNLKLLNLSANQLTSLPNKLPPSLLFLDMSQNQFSSIPKAVLSLENVKALLLNQNGLKKIPAEIEKLSCLRLLSIAGNPLEKIGESLARLPNLETLIISAEQWKKLPEELLSLKGVQILVQHPTSSTQTRNDSIVAPYQGPGNLRGSRRKKKKEEKNYEEGDPEEREEKERSK